MKDFNEDFIKSVSQEYTIEMFKNKWSGLAEFTSLVGSKEGNLKIIPNTNLFAIFVDEWGGFIRADGEKIIESVVAIWKSAYVHYKSLVTDDEEWFKNTTQEKKDYIEFIYGIQKVARWEIDDKTIENRNLFIQTLRDELERRGSIFKNS